MLLSVATFAPPAHYRFNANPQDLAIADLNGDGSPDVAAVLPGDSTIGILLNQGDGTFVRGRTIPDGTPHAIVAADFNHDGKMDLAVLGTDVGVQGANVEIFPGNGDGTFSKPVQHLHLVGAGPAIVAADVNGDGFADLVVTTAQRIGVLINQGDGTLAPAVYYASGGDHPSGLVVGDFNGDGVQDVAVSRGHKDDVSILLGNPAAPGTFGLPAFFPTGGNASAISVGDFNNDGKLDVAVTNSDFEKTALAVMIGNGDGTFRPAAMYGGANFSDAVVAGDFSGSGSQDIVVGSFDSELKLYPGNGDGTFGTPVVVNGGQFAQRVFTSDVNSDGRLDLLVTPYTGLRVLLNTSGTVPPPPAGTGLDKTLGAGNGKSFTFYTPEATLTTVSLGGRGSATLHFSDSGTVQIPNGTGTRTVNTLTPADISMTGTNAGSTLSIDVQGRSGSQTVDFTSISADSGLGSILARRTNVTGDVTLPGGVGQLALLSANGGTISIGAGRTPAIDVQQIGDEVVNSAAPIGQFRVRLDAGMTLTAPSLAGLTVGGSLINSRITLTAAGTTDLNTASIGGDVRDSTLGAAGNIGSVAARSIINSVLQAGVAAGVTLPTADADFIATASIGRVTLRVDSRRPSFANSVVAASQVGSLALGRVQTDNDAAPFGVAGRSIRSILGTDVTTGRPFRLVNVTGTAAATAALLAEKINPQDFVVEIL